MWLASTAYSPQEPSSHRRGAGTLVATFPPQAQRNRSFRQRASHLRTWCTVCKQVQLLNLYRGNRRQSKQSAGLLRMRIDQNANSYSHVRKFSESICGFSEKVRSKNFSHNSYWLYVAKNSLVSFIPRKFVCLASTKTDFNTEKMTRMR